MNFYVVRLYRAARLDSLTYEEVKNDTAATLHAIILFALVTVAESLLASLEGNLVTGSPLVYGSLSLLLWFANVTMLYILGTRLYVPSPNRPTYGQLFRAATFSLAPAVPAVVVGFILHGIDAPELISSILGLVFQLWALVALLVALCVAFEYESYWQAVWLLVLSSLIFGVPAALLILAWEWFW